MTLLCSAGHELDSGFAFCPTCGSPASFEDSRDSFEVEGRKVDVPGVQALAVDLGTRTAPDASMLPDAFEVHQKSLARSALVTAAGFFSILGAVGWLIAKLGSSDAADVSGCIIVLLALVGFFASFVHASDGGFRELCPPGWMRFEAAGGTWQPFQNVSSAHQRSYLCLASSGLIFWQPSGEYGSIAVQAIASIHLSRRTTPAGGIVTWMRATSSAGESFFLVQDHPDQVEVRLAPLRQMLGQQGLVRESVQ